MCFRYSILNTVVVCPEYYHLTAYCNNYEFSEAEKILPYLYKNSKGEDNEIRLMFEKVDNKTIKLFNNSLHKYMYGLGGIEKYNLKILNNKFKTKFKKIIIN